MDTLREMFWCSASYNFTVVATYWPGEKNVLADSVSRLHEHGKLFKLSTEYNMWYYANGSSRLYDPTPFDYVSLAKHMSFGSLTFIIEQVMAWRRQKWYLMGLPITWQPLP